MKEGEGGEVLLLALGCVCVSASADLSSVTVTVVFEGRKGWLKRKEE